MMRISKPTVAESCLQRMTYGTGSVRTDFALTHESGIEDLIESNARWSQRLHAQHAGLFSETCASGQQPHTLFIGCSDSRYSENCLGVLPGEVFTWRTIANVCVPADQSLNATLEFAIIALGVSRVVVCGHTDCGGIKTCVTGARNEKLRATCPSLYEYLADVQALVDANELHVHKGSDSDAVSWLAKQNVRRQLERLAGIPLVREYVANGALSLYGLLFDVSTGLVEEC